MLQAVRIEGLRSLTDTGFIDVKPLTILVGQNSSGKSTFVRFFPLLKQSFEANTSGPILWSGFVDFGTYREARYNKSNDSIKFNFKFYLDGPKDLFDIPSDTYIVHQSFFRRIALNENIDIDLMIELSENTKETTRVSKIECRVADSTIKIEISEDGQVLKYQVNSLNILGLGTKFSATHINTRSMLPTIVEIEPKESDFEPMSPFKFRRFESVVFKKLHEEVKKLSKIKLQGKIEVMASRLCQIGSSEAILEIIKKSSHALSWQKSTNFWDVNNQFFQRIRDLAIATTVPYFIEECDRYIASLSKNIRYIGPARVTAEQRTQRVNEFSVNEIDPQGKNLSLFLRDLNEEKKQAFDDWTSKYFGFKTAIKTISGHITLNMFFEQSNQEVNIADTGFGFSQMLPIITQLWVLSQKNNTLNDTNHLPIIFAIEQPELHLHPRMQKVLTDVLVSTIQAAKDNNIDLRLLVETHSEVLVNEVGNLIYKQKIKSEDVNVVVFEKLPQENNSKVRTAYYNEEGFLKK